jgi:hypothetical protein
LEEMKKLQENAAPQTPADQIAQTEKSLSSPEPTNPA